MKQLLLILTILTAFTGSAAAQGMPDVNKLMSMTPAQRQRYADSMMKAAGKNATAMADKYGMAIDETALPGTTIKPPVKDIAKLSLIPSRPPTRTELVQQVQQSRQQIKTVLPKPDIAEIEKFSAQKSTAELHDASIGRFYNNEPEKALYMMMSVATLQPDSIVAWNNLAAMYSMAGLSHKAIPMLQYCLKEAPGSSMILNNIGQAYLNLGELVKAREFLLQCLAADSLNPDANHSMGLLHLYANNIDEAMRSFERELSVAMRASTLAIAAKMGRKFNLRALMKKRNALNGRPQKDFFEEIHLGKFRIPSFPATVKAAYDQAPEFSALAASISGEMMFWNSIGYRTQEQSEQDGKAKPGFYSSLVQALLEELDEEFTPEYLSNYTDADFRAGMEIMTTYSNALVKVKCPPPPAGASSDVSHAYEVKCCRELRQPIIEQRMSAYGGFWEPRIRVAQGRWKSYINQMIEIVQLDPSPGNQLAVYKTVAAYFGFLANALNYSGAAEAVNKSLPICDELLTVAQADSVIEANRRWNLECPAWLNIEMDLGFGKIKADCNKYGMEVGDAIFGQYEYDFKTGSSTLAVGQGVKAKFFAGLGKASIKRMVYVTFDKNNKFADFGVRGKAEVAIGDTPFQVGPIKVGGTLAGVEATWQYGINTGESFTVKGKGIMAEVQKLLQ